MWHENQRILLEGKNKEGTYDETLDLGHVKWSKLQAM